MNPPSTGATRPSYFIIMSYKQQCKAEGVILTRIKIIRAVLKGLSQREAAAIWHCSKNTIGAIIRAYTRLNEAERQLLTSNLSLTANDLERFGNLACQSRAPNSNKRSLPRTDEALILTIHKKITMGPKRMHTHLARQNRDMEVYTLSKIKGVYKRQSLVVKKVRTMNGERRPLYDYASLAAFQYLHYDTKHITDQHALPKAIYQKFLLNPDLPIYQWTIIDAKTRTRFLAYSHHLSSYFGQRFLLLTICWLRSHTIDIHINVLFDGGAEFCSASKNKLGAWQSFFDPYGVTVEQTDGDKIRQNLVERSHRPDDEEFYCPRGEYINNKTDFLIEAQNWNLYWNCLRSHSGIGMNDHTPVEMLTKLGYTNAQAIGSFPTFILEDIHQELVDLPKYMEERRGLSQNVLTYYPNQNLAGRRQR